MSFLLDEISKLKRSRSASLSDQPQKYVKISHYEEKRIAEYQKAQAEKEQKKKEKELEKLQSLKKEYKCTDAVKEIKFIALPVEEVKRRLILRRQPITLFGESNEAREERLLALELAEPNIPDFEKGKEWEGSEFHKKLEEDNYEEDFEVQKKKKEEGEDVNFKIETREPTTTEEEILFYFREVLRNMGLALEKRSESEKKSAAGRQETALYGQTRSFIKPFFVDLQEQNVPTEVVSKVSEIVHQLKIEQFIKAADTYYKMAIGNAAWPIGITGIGIHERSAHERIAVAEVGHILNDETQRKYIQAIKRLMTFVQKEKLGTNKVCIM